LPLTHLWDYVDATGRNELQAWADDERLGIRERAQLNQKLDMLQRIGLDAALHLQFVARPSDEFSQVFQLVVKSRRALRPLLCPGPVDLTNELTLLRGAIANTPALVPLATLKCAEACRKRVIADTAAGIQRRVAHLRF
jgi:hypothetical protein